MSLFGDIGHALGSAVKGVAHVASDVGHAVGHAASGVVHTVEHAASGVAHEVGHLGGSLIRRQLKERIASAQTAIIQAAPMPGGGG